MENISPENLFLVQVFIGILLIPLFIVAVRLGFYMFLPRFMVRFFTGRKKNAKPPEADSDRLIRRRFQDDDEQGR